MAIANTIAQAGISAGRNIQNTVSNGLVRRENQKRYEAQQLAQEKSAQIEQARYQNEQSQLQASNQLTADKYANTQARNVRLDQFGQKKHNDGQMEKGLAQLAQIYQNTPPENYSKVQSAAKQYFAKLGIDVGDLDPSMVMNSIERPDTFSMMTDEQAVEAGLPSGKKYQQNSGTGKILPIGGGGITIQNGGEQEDAFQKAAGGALQGEYQSVYDAGGSAEDQQETLNVLANLDLNTGWGTQAKLGLGRAVASVWGEQAAEEITGVNVSAAQAFKSIESKMVNAVLNVAKGPQTEGDAIRAKAQLLSLGNTPEANKWILSYMTALNARKIEQSEFFRNYQDKNDNRSGVFTAWRNFKKSTPMLSDTQRTENGSPLFFNQFIKDVKALNPGATQDQIIKAWRKQEKGSK